MGELENESARAIYSFGTFRVSQGEDWRSCPLLPGNLLFAFGICLVGCVQGGTTMTV